LRPKVTLTARDSDVIKTMYAWVWVSRPSRNALDPNNDADEVNALFANIRLPSWANALAADSANRANESFVWC
jgi:hypothetical protein